MPGVLPDHRLWSAAARLGGLLLVILASLGTLSRAQDHSDGEEDEEKKHYLTFQVSYFGSARLSGEDQTGKRETIIDVNDRFTGRVEVRPTEAYDLPTSPEAQLKQMAAIQAAMAAGDLDAVKAATPTLLVTWFPRGDQVEITGTISETMESTSATKEMGESRAKTERTTETYRGQKVFPGSFGNAFVKIRAEEKKYDLQFTLMPDMAATWEAVRQSVIRVHEEEGHNRHEESENAAPLDAGPNQLNLGYSNYQIPVEVKGQPLAGEANELIGTTRIPVPKPAGWDGSWDIAMLVSWQIDITLPPVELVVTAPGYDEWRPEGNIKKPTEPGNELVARATLKPKDGEGKFVPRVKSIRFQLLDTSREPGVCLNWPLGAKDADYDMRLAAVSGGTLSGNEQTLEVSDPKRNEAGHVYAEVQIDSYDFGGRASLRAVCTLADGREVEGVMKGADGDQEMPRLPKMKSSGWIADSWRQKNNAVNLADDDDEEKVDGQPLNGDGFTLYEEYRGWVHKGKHLEGDPKRKDFFVRNKIGADAKGGIALFDRVSKLRTHAELRATEMIELATTETESVADSKGERIMNWNHRDAPHRVDQHAVILINTTGFRSSGAATQGVYNDDKVNRAFRPGKALYVRVEERARSDGTFSTNESTSKYNLSERDAAFAYDRGVAHELLHAVGVDHHGEGEQARSAYFQAASDPMNSTHRARFVPYMPPTDDDLGLMSNGRPAVWTDFDRGPTITLLWEDTKEDVAQSLSADFERELAAERENPIWTHTDDGRAAKFPQYGKDAHFWTETMLHENVSNNSTRRGIMEGKGKKFNRSIIVGRHQQADSGNELCLMRYYFANAYPVDAQEKAFYLVRPGGNRAGRDLCKSPEGTGANAESHAPKSRFGDSAPGRGGCFSFICPNDAIPPRAL